MLRMENLTLPKGDGLFDILLRGWAPRRILRVKIFYPQKLKPTLVTSPWGPQ